MANYFYKLAVGGIFAIIIIGAYMAFTGYSSDVYPLDMSVGLLDRIMASSNPQSILVDLNAIKMHFFQQKETLFGYFQLTLQIL